MIGFFGTADQKGKSHRFRRL